MELLKNRIINYSLEPMVGDDMQPSLFHCSVFPSVVPNSALVNVVRHCIITGPPKIPDMHNILS